MNYHIKWRPPWAKHFIHSIFYELSQVEKSLIGYHPSKSFLITKLPVAPNALTIILISVLD